MKKVIKTSVALWVVMGLASACSQRNDLVQSEAAVQALSRSVFNPGQTISQPGTLALLSGEPFSSGTDGGYIAPPNQSTGSSTGSGGEAGSIPGPTTNSPDTQTDAGSVTGGTIPSDSTIVAGGSDSGTIPSDSTIVAGGSDSGTIPSDSTIVAGGSDSGAIPSDSTIVAGGSDSGAIPSDSTIVAGSSTDSGGLDQTGSVDNGSSDLGVVVPPVDPGAVAVDDSGTVIPPTGSGTVAQNTDSSSSSGSSGGGSSCPHSGAKPACSCTCKPSTPNTEIKFQLRRVCSVKRSNSKSLFFEDAKNPILSIEAVNNSGFLAMPGFYQGSKAFSLASVSLKGVDLMKGKFSGKAATAIAAFKKAKGWFWGSTYVDLKVCEDSNRNGFCYDEPVGNQLALDVPELKAGSLPRSLQVNVFSGRSLTKSANPGLCETQYSPLVFDLRGNGFDFIGPEAGVSFDINDSGSPIPTGWIYSKDDALLVHDLNGSRKIESGAELFGNATRLPSGERAVNGFEALRVLDSDSNGLITSKDRAWTDLRLWIDANHDGVSQQRELMTLDRAGIESISLAYASVMEVDQFGNQTRERSTFVRRYRSKRHVLTVSDIWFNSFVAE